jgi:hypothetical protein
MNGKAVLYLDMKRIELNKTVYELCTQFPELPKLLADMGFKDIALPGMISTVGRFMTIPKGAAAKKIDMNIIKQTLTDQGYVVEEGI